MGPLTSAGIAGRRLRGELRLYRRPAVALLAVVFAAVCVAALLLGQTYARDQVAAASADDPTTCAELQSAGVPADQCASARRSIVEGRRGVAHLAAEVGPGAVASQRPLGSLTLVLGHAATAVGLILLAAIAALVLGAEGDLGIAPLRDRHLLGPAAWWVRPLALVLAWGAIVGAAWIVVWLVDRSVRVPIGWHGAVGQEASAGLAAGRAGALALVGVVAACVAVALRGVAASRGRLLAAGVLAAGGMLALAVVVPPVGALWATGRWRAPSLGFIDRVPTGFAPPEAGVGAAAGAVAVVAAAVLLVRASLRH